MQSSSDHSLVYVESVKRYGKIGKNAVVTVNLEHKVTVFL